MAAYRNRLFLSLGDFLLIDLQDKAMMLLTHHRFETSFRIKGLRNDFRLVGRYTVMTNDPPSNEVAFKSMYQFFAQATPLSARID